MTVRADRSATGVGQRVLMGASILLGSNLVVRLIALAGLTVLARLLSPQDYGIQALAMVVVAFTNVLTSVRIDDAIIRLGAVDDSHYRTAFTLSLLRGLLAGGAIFAFARPVAGWMGEPAVGPVLEVLALLPVIAGLRNPRFVDFARRLNLSSEAVLTVSAELVLLVVSVVLALLWGNYWALVLGSVAAVGTSTVLSYALLPHRPRFGLRHWRMFLGFGGWLAGAHLLHFTNYRIDTVVVGSRLGSAALGQYNMGMQIASLSSQQLAAVFNRAIYVGLSHVNDDRERLRRAYRRAQATVLGVVLPIGVGSALLAREIVLVLAGAQWLEAIPVLQVLAPALAFGMVAAGTAAMLKVEGDTRAMFLREALNLAVRLPVLFLGLYAFGLIGVVWAHAFGRLFGTLTMLHLARRYTGEPIWGPVAAAWRSLAACALMVVAIFVLDSFLPAAGLDTLGNASNLAIKVAVGAAVYVAVHLVLWLAQGRPDGFEAVVFSIVQRLLKRIGF
jgi:PST family polysaccharide transporter